MAGVSRLVELVHMYTLGAFYALFVLGYMLRKLVTVGPRRMFTVKARQRPACLDDAAHGEHAFIRLKEVRLHYVATGPKDAPLMLFAHGFPECWYSWRHQMKHFSKSHRVVAYDMRGYGESDKPRGVDSYSMYKLAADLDQLITALGYEKCVFVGHDWGVVIGFIAAAMYPHRFERLIMLNGPHQLAFMERVATSATQYRRSWYVYFFQLWPLAELLFRANDYTLMMLLLKSKNYGVKPGTFTAQDLEAFKYQMSTLGHITAGLNYYRYFLRNAKAVVSKMKSEIPVPTLVIWATGDAFLEREMAEMSCSYVRAHSQVTYIEGASHWVQQEEPDQVNECMDRYLAQDVTSPGASER